MASETTLAEKFEKLDKAEIRGKACEYCQVILINGFATMDQVIEAAKFIQRLYKLQNLNGKYRIDELRVVVDHWINAIDELNNVDYWKDNFEETMTNLYIKYFVGKSINKSITKSENITIQGFIRAFHYICYYLSFKRTTKGENPDFLDGRLLEHHEILKRIDKNLSTLTNWRFNSNNLDRGKKLFGSIQIKAARKIGVRAVRKFLVNLNSTL